MKRPVSEKYYQKLCERVKLIIRNLGHFSSHADYVIRFIDEYLENRSIPGRNWEPQHLTVIFFSLLPDIDEAIARSAACHRRAEERRARKKAETATNTTKSDRIGDSECLPENPGVSDSVSGKPSSPIRKNKKLVSTPPHSDSVRSKHIPRHIPKRS